MPIYTFQDTETGEVWDENCSWNDRCAFLEAHPHITTLITSAPSLVRGKYTSGIKNDDGWNENLSRIAEAHPGTPLAERYGRKDTKTVKTRQAVNKWKKHTGGVNQL